jgi:hypothetical protein
MISDFFVYYCKLKSTIFLKHEIPQSSNLDCHQLRKWRSLHAVPNIHVYSIVIAQGFFKIGFSGQVVANLRHFQFNTHTYTHCTPCKSSPLSAVDSYLRLSRKYGNGNGNFLIKQMR